MKERKIFRKDKPKIKRECASCATSIFPYQQCYKIHKKSICENCFISLVKEMLGPEELTKKFHDIFDASYQCSYCRKLVDNVAKVKLSSFYSYSMMPKTLRICKKCFRESIVDVIDNEYLTDKFISEMIAKRI